VNTLGGEVVELIFVSLHLSDEVYEVLGLGELVQVLGIDNVSELILDLDD
jgi:hypothetical protein